MPYDEIPVFVLLSVAIVIAYLNRRPGLATAVTTVMTALWYIFVDPANDPDTTVPDLVLQNAWIVALTCAVDIVMSITGWATVAMDFFYFTGGRLNISLKNIGITVLFVVGAGIAMIISNEVLRYFINVGVVLAAHGLYLLSWKLDGTVPKGAIRGWRSSNGPLKTILIMALFSVVHLAIQLVNVSSWGTAVAPVISELVLQIISVAANIALGVVFTLGFSGAFTSTSKGRV